MTPQTMLSKAMAAARAREMGRPDRILNDPLAVVLAGDDGRALLERLDSLHPGDPSEINPIAVRACFLDEILWDAANAEGGPRQVVVLSAGMDTRAFRISWPSGTTVYEVDDAETLAEKQRLLDGDGATPQAAAYIADWQFSVADDRLPERYQTTADCRRPGAAP